jgi:hypothetical protein
MEQADRATCEFRYENVVDFRDGHRGLNVKSCPFESKCPFWWH